MKNNFLFSLFFILLIVLYFFLQNDFLSNQKITTHINNNLFLRVDKIRDIKIKKKHIKTPKSVRAVYMSSWIAGSPKLRSKLIKFITESRINALIIDIKDYSGLISFKTNNSLINEHHTDSNRINDIDDLIRELHDKNIYIIGRVTVFQDPLLAKVRPDFAFKCKDNKKIWKDKKGLAFINPQKKVAWEYFATIAETSYRKGFDEINFDYIRYPSDGNISNLDYALNGVTKLSAMKHFYQFLDERLRTQGIPISADMFGYVTSMKSILSIGQKIDDAFPYFDAIAPMVYPSHYKKNYLGFENAAAHPYDVVYHEMKLAKEKADLGGFPDTILRTWIQDFDLGATYGKKEIQDQIKGSYDANVLSYMVWDPTNIYTKSAYYHNFLKKYEKK